MYNQTNVDRTLSVLKNLTAEFTQPQYGGVVSGTCQSAYSAGSELIPPGFLSVYYSGIELLNEPRLTNNFTMASLKRFYSQATEIVRDAAVSNIEVVIHGQSSRTCSLFFNPRLILATSSRTPDAFWGPNYWADYDPSSISSSSSSSPDWLVLDTHQYYAFAPYQNLPREDILQHICNISRILKSTTSGIPKTIVGEWSLETGTPPNMTKPRYGGLTQAKRTWFRQLFEAQLAAYSPNALDQPSNGFYYWTWKTEYDIDTWSYQVSRLHHPPLAGQGSNRGLM
jgi:glucan 1,3-beta-glucosidase